MVYQTQKYSSLTSLVNITDYYPFGKELRFYKGEPNEKFLSTQHERDRASNYDHRQARNSTSEFGVFLSVDPLADHPSQVDKSPYAYVWNNPVNLTDPDGRCPTCKSGDEAKEIYRDGAIVENNQGKWKFNNGEWEVLELYGNDQSSQEETESSSSGNNLIIVYNPLENAPTREPYEGFLGAVEYILTGGIDGAYRYDRQGSPTAVAPIAGDAPGASKFGKVTKTTIKSINQLNKLVKTGKLPKTITRFDKGKILGELDHVHFSNGAALNINGTWKHGSKILTKEEIKILTKNGWTLPR
ncbi:MAG: RHS repeat domain-containing protein [Luteibaculaceae bacterium]